MNPSRIEYLAGLVIRETKNQLEDAKPNYTPEEYIRALYGTLRAIAAQVGVTMEEVVNKEGGEPQ